MSARDAQLADHLAKVDRDLRSLQEEGRLAARRRESLDAAEARLRLREEALEQREEISRRRLKDEVDRQVREARREIDTVIASLKAKTSSIAGAAAARPVPTGQMGAARQEAQAAVETIARRFAGPAAEPAPPASEERPPDIGDRVVHGSLGLEGTVTAVHGDRAEIEVRGKRMRADVRQLRVVGGPRRQPAAVNVHVELQPRDATPADLNVIGCTVDEALSRAERFLDEVLLSDQRVVRFIHGHGTGQLRRALAAFLAQHPLVQRFAPAPPEGGGGGVTVVELKE
jgi:DNA mismatch repair protein MutS2